MTASLTTTPTTPGALAQVERIVDLATNGADSPHTRRAYRRHLAAFIVWTATAGRALTRETVMHYREHLIASATPATTNQALSAIRKLAEEAAANGLIADADARAIVAVKGVSQKGTKTGKWLTRPAAEKLINTPDTSTLKGLRDRAILAVAIGAGLRREEIASLTPAHVQSLEDRPVIVDLVGKGKRVRTVPIARWVKFAIDAYLVALGTAPKPNEPLFVPLRRGNHPQPGGMTAQAIWNLLQEHAAAADVGTVAPHDLRRTYAKLARKAGAELEQIQITLGHANIATTQRYLGTDLDLDNAPSDNIAIRLNA